MTKEQIRIFDTTLRDGEQAAGASMTEAEKLIIAEALDEMAEDESFIIEAGFAISSEGELNSIKQISQLAKKATICSLARASKKDIDVAAEAIKPAKKGRIHTFISTSPVHMEYKLKMKPEEVLEAIKTSVSYARQFTDDVEWSAEDATRTERDFLLKAVEIAIKAGATTINLPDTVGYTLPQEMAEIIIAVKNHVPNIDKAVLSTHCHDDLGLAVANSLAAVKAGARQVECTINGIGERAGNAALEEIVMAIHTRKDLMPYSVGVKTEHITRVSKLVSSITGMIVQPNKAIVGDNAFAHESGIHQDGVLKNRQTYEILTPESVGLTSSKLPLGKLSGRAAFRDKLKELAVHLDDEAVNKAFKEFKALADKKKTIYDEDILTIVDSQASTKNNRIKFGKLYIACGSEGQNADLTLIIDGEEKRISSDGSGPVDALFNAVKKLVPHEAVLKLYQVHAVTEGTDAQADVSVRLEHNDRFINGRGSDVDTLVASAKAYINALNNLV